MSKSVQALSDVEVLRKVGSKCMRGVRGDFHFLQRATFSAHACGRPCGPAAELGSSFVTLRLTRTDGAHKGCNALVGLFPTGRLPAPKSGCSRPRVRGTQSTVAARGGMSTLAGAAAASRLIFRGTRLCAMARAVESNGNWH